MPDVKISYEDLLSGDRIPIAGVGHLRSPQLKEMRPTSGIGWNLYRVYVFYLKQGKEDLAQLLKFEFPEMSVFDIVISIDELRNLYQDALAFFMSECVRYDTTSQSFVCIQIEPNGGETIVGTIDRDNFDEVRLMILTLNYISTKDVDVAVKFSSDAAKQAWEQVQEYMRQNQEQASRADNDIMQVGNLISKLCAMHPSINYTNVFELTVFQFYDTFFQMSYLRQIGFTEDIVANHGSDQFQYEDWLKPVQY